MFQYLAHNLKLRKFLESSIIAWFKQWNKLTTASSFDKEISILSNRKAAAFALENFQNATYFTSKSQLYSFVGNQILSNHPKAENLFAEFGVYKGHSINFFAKINPKIQWYGFDSFHGLPENWSGNSKTKSAFNQYGKLPKVEKNITLLPGYFNQVLPTWIKAQNKKIAFIHLDADLYSSTKDVLNEVTNFVDSNTYFFFDEYFGYVGWEYGEHKAWMEWLNTNHKQPNCIAYAANGTALFQFL